jgi:hypothetical protein
MPRDDDDDDVPHFLANVVPSSQIFVSPLISAAQWAAAQRPINPVIKERERERRGDCIAMAILAAILSHNGLLQRRALYVNK